MMRHRLLLACVTVLAVTQVGCTARSPQSPAGEVAAPYGLTQWEPLPTLPGAMLMRLAGDPAQPGLFAYRLQFPDGAQVPPHTHNVDLHGVVLSGELLVYFAETISPAVAPRRLTPGSFLVVPAGTPHYEVARGETVLHVSGYGPMTTVPVGASAENP